jgi:hypothetical protein
MTRRLLNFSGPGSAHRYSSSVRFASSNKKEWPSSRIRRHVAVRNHAQVAWLVSIVHLLAGTIVIAPGSFRVIFVGVPVNMWMVLG